MKIGVFDSGVGGLSMARAIKKSFPRYEILLKEDKKNLPYGTKSPEELLNLVLPILQELVEDNCDIIVIACNTVTTNIIKELRSKIKVPLIGIEPMIKPAAEITETKVIGVFATPGTLNSERYKYLKAEYCQGKKVIEPDCSDWAEKIEANTINKESIKHNVEHLVDNNADVIVLGCTHYHWISDLVDEIADGNATVIHPEQPVISRLRTVIERLG